MAKAKDAPRREGYELEVSKPRVIIKTADGIKMEPYEGIPIDFSYPMLSAYRIT